MRENLGLGWKVGILIGVFAIIGTVNWYRTRPMSGSARRSVSSASTAPVLAAPFIHSKTQKPVPQESCSPPDTKGGDGKNPSACAN